MREEENLLPLPFFLFLCQQLDIEEMSEDEQKTVKGQMAQIIINVSFVHHFHSNFFRAIHPEE